MPTRKRRSARKSLSERKPWEDEVLREVYAVRDAYAAEHDYDLDRIYADLKRREARSRLKRTAATPKEPAQRQLGPGRVLKNSGPAAEARATGKNACATSGDEQRGRVERIRQDSERRSRPNGMTLARLRCLFPAGTALY